MSSSYLRSPHFAWKSDYFLRALEERLEQIELLSLDVFDTLLFRTVAEPADVFARTAEAALREGHLTGLLTPEQFRTVRMQAERNARERRLKLDGHDEITLEQIYEELPAGIGDVPLLLQRELELERQACYLNPNVFDLIRWCRARGVRVALLSDMYLSAEQIRSFLRASGMADDYVDLLLVSSEEKCSKASGGLFARLLAAYPSIPASAMLHIGDQLRSDVHGAAIHSIPALHYAVVPDTFERPCHWDAILHGGGVPPAARSLTKLAEYTVGPDLHDDKEMFYYQVGVRTLGPFLAAFCEWVIDVCVAEGRDEVHPLMREAVMLAPLLEQIIAQRGISLRVKPIYISRMATYLASMEQFGVKEREQLLASDITVQELFRILDLADHAEPFQADWLLTLKACKENTDAAGGTSFDRLSAYLQREDVHAGIQHSMLRHRQLLIDYIRQTCGDPARIVTVDIGFHGTIQRNLEAVLRSGGELQAIHLLAVGGGGLERLLLRGMDIRCHLGGAGQVDELGGAIVRSPAFIEELMMGAFGTALGYERDSRGKVTPVLAPLNQALAEQRHKEVCRQGVLAFQRSWNDLREVKPDLIASPPQAREWYKPLHRAIAMPTPEEARLLGGLLHQDHYLNEEIPICQPIPERWFDRGEEAFLRVCNFGASTLNLNWPQGTLTNHSPYFLYEHYLKTRDSFGYADILFEMARELERLGIKEIVLLGSGRLADRMLERAYWHGIYVKIYIASLEQLAEQAQSSQLDATLGYVIASLTEEDIAAWREAIGRIGSELEEAPELEIIAVYPKL